MMMQSKVSTGLIGEMIGCDDGTVIAFVDGTRYRFGTVNGETVFETSKDGVTDGE